MRMRGIVQEPTDYASALRGPQIPKIGACLTWVTTSWHRLDEVGRSYPSRGLAVVRPGCGEKTIQLALMLYRDVANKAREPRVGDKPS